MSSPRSSSVPQYFQTMSPVAPAPQPSNPPSSMPDSERQSPRRSSALDASFSLDRFPDPKLRLELRDLSHSSSDVFLENFKAGKDFKNLVQAVLHTLYTGKDAAQTEPTPTTTTRPHPSSPKVPGTRSVTLIVRDIDGVAYTTGKELDSDHKEIHFALKYISHASRTGQTAEQIRHELLGVVCHELVHCFQWAARGTAPGGLIEGIADWVRLRAGYAAPHWKRDVDGDWDRGYQNTAYFLDWIEKTKGPGSVFTINQALADKEYKEDHFWKHLFGESVKDLYKEYARQSKEADARATPTTLVTTTSES